MALLLIPFAFRRRTDHKTSRRINPQIATGIPTATPMMAPFEILPWLDELLVTDLVAKIAERVDVVRRVVIVVNREVSGTDETGTLRDETGTLEDEVTEIPTTMEAIGCFGSVMVEV